MERGDIGDSNKVAFFKNSLYVCMFPLNNKDESSYGEDEINKLNQHNKIKSTCGGAKNNKSDISASSRGRKTTTTTGDRKAPTNIQQRYNTEDIFRGNLTISAVQS